MTPYQELDLAYRIDRNMHADVVQCNDFQYGYRRIRALFNESWYRDLLRVNGGITYCSLVGEIDVLAPRQFQSNHYSPAILLKPVWDGVEDDFGRKVLLAGETK